MIFKQLWARHLLYQLVLIFLFALTCFYVLYIVIDYSIHSHHFSKSAHLTWSDLSRYYFYLLMKRADLILPLAFVIATNRVLLSLNQSHALIALLVGGLHPLKLLAPFFTMASFLALTLLLNFEFVTPHALDYLESFEHQNFRKKTTQDYSMLSAYSIPMQDGSSLSFSRYDHMQNLFEDVYYIISAADIWKMKSLRLEDHQYRGYYVEHLAESAEGLLTKENSYPEFVFPYLHIDLSGASKVILPSEQKSLSSLYQIVCHPHFFSSVPRASALTQLNFKLLIPFISFLLIIACAPFCIKFVRKLPIFMIYAMSIFGVIAFFIVMDAAVILGEHQILPPGVAILLPYMLCLAGFGKKFIKTYIK